MKTEKARKIIRKAERDLLQARVKSINSLLGYNVKQRELCRSQLASILSTSTMNKCQELIDKLNEFRYLKVRERQINKSNRLLHKKEGNITWSVPASTPVNSTFLQLVPDPQRLAVLLPKPSALPARQLVIPRQAVG